MTADMNEGNALARSKTPNEGVRPLAVRLAQRLQVAAYNHGYEDAHPADSERRQNETSAMSQQLLSDLRDEITRLVADAQRHDKRTDYPCRYEGRCQYAIDSDAENIGRCPRGNCVMHVLHVCTYPNCGCFEPLDECGKTK